VPYASSERARASARKRVAAARAKAEAEDDMESLRPDLRPPGYLSKADKEAIRASSSPTAILAEHYKVSEIAIVLIRAGRM
jgi:hypothetical protein